MQKKTFLATLISITDFYSNDRKQFFLKTLDILLIIIILIIIIIIIVIIIIIRAQYLKST